MNLFMFVQVWGFQLGKSLAINVAVVFVLHAVVKYYPNLVSISVCNYYIGL